MSEIAKISILGSGIAGLGAAWRAQEQNQPHIIFESRSRPGGLLDNFEIEGFRFDKAVHLSFAKEATVRQVFDQTAYITHNADSKCFEKGIWMKHPVQNNLYPLLPEEKTELIASFVDRPNDIGANYAEWLTHQYGRKISERFPITYTKKYWDTDAKQLSTSWIGNRMRRASLEEILYGSYSDDTPNTYYTKYMRYPKNGGYRSFIEPMIQTANIEYNKCATKLDLKNKLITFSDGNQSEYSNLVSSIPLPVLASITDHLPTDVSDAAQSLKATSIDLISVAFNTVINTDLWFYIYDEDILASRVHSPSLKSPSNAPKNCSSLQFEFYSRGTESKFQKSDLIENTLYAIKKMKIADVSDIRFIDHKHVKYGNVIFDLGMEEKRKKVRQYFANNGVTTVGRFGEWDYLWSNQSFLSGYNWAEQNG